MLSSLLIPPQVSFEELGWLEHIVQPLSFTSNFCAGRCNYPITSTHNVTKHSYIQSLAHEMNPNVVPPPCCAPHTTESLTITFRENADTFVNRIWGDMKVTSCGCYWALTYILYTSVVITSLFICFFFTVVLCYVKLYICILFLVYHLGSNIQWYIISCF